MIGTMAIAANERTQVWHRGAVAATSPKSIWKVEPQIAATAKAAFVRPHHSVMQEYLLFTCLNLGMAGGMMLAIAEAFNWVAKACMVPM